MLKDSKHSLLKNVGILSPRSNRKPPLLTRRAKRRGGGAPLVASLTELPDQANIVIWYDFTDITTLFEDEAKATQITVDGEVIDTVANKANPGTYDITTTATGPDYETDDASGVPCAGFTEDNLNATITPVPGSGAYSYCAIGRSPDVELTQYYATYDPHECSMRVFSDDTLINGCGGAIDQSTGTITGAGLFASIAIDHGDESQTFYYSMQAATETGSGAADFPENGTQLTLGGFNGGAEYDGKLFEYIFWNSDVTADVQTIKDYIADKYGLTGSW